MHDSGSHVLEAASWGQVPDWGLKYLLFWCKGLRCMLISGVAIIPL